MTAFCAFNINYVTKNALSYETFLANDLLNKSTFGRDSKRDYF